MYATLKQTNSDFTLLPVTAAAFQQFGQIITNIDAAALLSALKAKPIPETGNTYVATDQTLEKVVAKTMLPAQVFGDLPIQVGYCNGHSSQLNCLEWHQSPEVNVATTDMVLFLGDIHQLQADAHYQTTDVTAFFVPAGVMIMLYGTTMHFAPCQTTPHGFQCMVALQRGINTPLTNKSQVPTLFQRGKWLIAHPANTKFIEQGAFPGIIGPNYTVKLA
ncbi:DUF4867 family protein [Loigolactobacillus jiayinensis]|uniref:DUF4867 family protein n=1 Tax=Loigolactobacillus jiayinensis TaxID=2486016 RepID=A0ABW1R8N7_9LACO|nr:DUF4867 family protein [Loigolactobacillus jiayinensis]